MPGTRIALAALALVAVLTAASQAAPQHVTKVTVTGVAGENLTAAERVIRIRAGDTYTEKAVQDDVLALYDLPFVASAKATKNVTAEGVEVTYELAAKGEVKGIIFTGNKMFSAKKLLREAKLEDFKNYDQARLAAAKDAIIDKYKKAGYLFVKVDFASQTDGTVLFKIDEGPKLRVVRVNIIGNAAFDDAVLKKKIRTKTRRYLILAYRLDESVVEEDRLTLQEFYRDSGYLDAKVGLALDLTANKKGIIVDFKIEEGKLYTVRFVTVSGNTLITTPDLLKVLKMKGETPFSISRLNDDERAIKGAFGHVGYIDCDVSARTTFAAEAPFVDVAYSVREGTPIEVGEVEVFGNDKTRDNVIRRDLEFYPGERYDTDKLELSKKNLQRLSYFSKIEIVPDEAPAGTSPRNATVKVEEASTGRFLIGAAINSNAGLMGNIAYQQRNFDYRQPPKSFKDITDGRAYAGGGQQFELDAMPGTEYSQMRMAYRDPRVNDSDYSLGLELHLWQRHRETFSERRAGGDVSVGKRIAKYAFWETGFAADNVRISSIDKGAPTDVTSVRGVHEVNALRYTLGHDTRDNFQMPTTGHRITGTVEGSHSAIGSDYNFARVRADGSWYTTLHRDRLDRPYVVSWRARIAYMLPESNSDAPIFERYFVGGAYDMRGFAFRGMGPRAGDQPLGGRFMTVGGLQYEWPLAGDYFRGALFYDAGTLVTEPGDLTLGQFRHSVGTGIRFVMPPPINWPISLDFAVPLKKERGDDTQVISFSIGLTM